MMAVKVALFVCLVAAVLADSDVGGVCGGNTANAQVCNAGLKCLPDATGASVGDVGGHCHTVSAAGGACGGSTQFPPVCAEGLTCNPPVNVIPGATGTCAAPAVSDVGGVCGGNTATAKVCKAGLKCVPDASGASSPASGDVGGHCHSVSVVGGACGGSTQYPPVCAEGMMCNPSNSGLLGATGTCACLALPCLAPLQGCTLVNATIDANGCKRSCGDLSCPLGGVGDVCGGPRLCKPHTQCIPDAVDPTTGAVPTAHCHAVSGAGGACGGNIQYPPVCHNGLYCDTSVPNAGTGGTCQKCAPPPCAFPGDGCHYENQVIMDGCLKQCGNIVCNTVCSMLAKLCPDGTSRSAGPPPACKVPDCDPLGCNNTSCPTGFFCNKNCQYQHIPVSKCEVAAATPSYIPPCSLGCSDTNCGKNLYCNPWCVMDGLLLKKCQPDGIRTTQAPFPKCSLIGQPCGGLIVNAPQCAPGLSCNMTNAIADKAGVCVKA